MNFDFIGILDPSQEENKFIWKSLGLNPKFRWSNAKFITSKNAQKEKEKSLKKEYSQLSRSTLIDLYQKYKIDYDMFGFDFDYILKLAGYAKLTEKEKNMKPKYF